MINHSHCLFLRKKLCPLYFSRISKMTGYYGSLYNIARDRLGCPHVLHPPARIHVHKRLLFYGSIAVANYNDVACRVYMERHCNCHCLHCRQ